MERLNLSGTWTMTRSDSAKAIPAVLPGTDFGALIHAGEIETPLRSGIDADAREVALADTTFRRTFTVPESLLDCPHVHFVCDCIDTLCDSFINGEQAFSSNNAFIPADFDVKRYLKPGENEIELRFSSPVKFIENEFQKKALPANPNGINGIPYLRKPGCHFGWDWGPCVPYSGLLAPAELIGFSVRITDVRIQQETTPDRAVVTASAAGATRITLTTPDGETLESRDGVFQIEHPSLWSTYELSGKDVQPLYTVTFENDEDTVVKRIGLRTLTLDRSADRYGENFCFVLNGTPIFAKGANLIPLSALFEDEDEDALDRYLALARKGNFNMLRIWGGGFYASERLLSRCDEMGILIWQDFCYACQMYPFYDEDFHKLVLREALLQVRRFDTHPSVALWCGNNELEAMFSYLPRQSALVKAYVKFFYETLPETVHAETAVPYIPTSPMGSAPFHQVTKDNCGDTHMWNVWHGLKKLSYYQTRHTRFLSEFGLESLPSMKAIASFAAPKDYSLSSAPFLNHQKCIGGNPKMLFYLSELFDDPQDFSDLPVLTGLVQSECAHAAAVHLRQQKGRCNGCLIWQFNDVWNCPSWSMVDFEEIPKAVFYHARAFFAPVAVTSRLERGRMQLFAHNDTGAEAEFDLTVRVLDSSTDAMRETTQHLNLKAGETRRLEPLRVKNTDVVQLRWLDYSETLLCCPPRRLKLREAALHITKTETSLTIKSDGFAYGVHITADKAPDDNDFSLFPGEEKTVHFASPVADAQVTSVNGMRFSRRPLRRIVKRLLYRLQPRNIANAVFYAIN